MDLAVWPGDTPVQRDVLLDMKYGDNLTLSTLRSTVHAGSHADAPSHYGVDAPSIEGVPLERFMGSCQVMRVTARPNARFTYADLAGEVTEERILLQTNTYPNPETFHEDFGGLDPTLVDDLANRSVRLIGVDTPSVDLFSSKDLPAHRACLRHDILILEGLVLEGVPEGVYELIALPLRLAGFDASPVRAILRTP
jgi:arylformamidase